MASVYLLLAALLLSASPDSLAFVQRPTKCCLPCARGHWSMLLVDKQPSNDALATEKLRVSVPLSTAVIEDKTYNGSSSPNAFSMTTEEAPVESNYSPLIFMGKASLVGLFTGLLVVIFKTALGITSALFYENLAALLPKPAFYWPLALYPILGASIVSVLTYFRGQSIRDGIDFIARSIDANEDDENGERSIAYNPVSHFFRICAAIATLGSGISLGPEGSAVEIGAGVSRMLVGAKSAVKERHHLFLAGTAAGVSAGFNAPISGVFFAIECGNRYLNKNTIKLDENAPDGPRADIAGIVIAAAIADLIVGLGGEETNMLTVQGNLYAMASPIFELSLYIGLGLISGLISVAFTSLREWFSQLFTSEKFSSISPALLPLLGGVVCGVIAVFFPQTLFVGYTTLDQLLGGKIVLPTLLLVQLLVLKIFLSSFSLGTGLIGGVFAPALFFGATAGTAYHDVIAGGLAYLNEYLSHATLLVNHPGFAATLPSFLSMASAPAYATVGAAATLGALFRAPLTSSMLMFEITQNHDIVLPVLISSGLAGLIAEIASHPRKQW